MTRGPYLQHADDGVAVVWYTDDARRRARALLHGSRGHRRGRRAGRTGDRHEATLRGLAPGMRYSYRVFSPLGPLASTSGEVEFSFRAPETGVLRFVAFGDCGSGTAASSRSRRRSAPSRSLPDLVMIVGDVVYSPFDAASYDAKFFAPYAALLPQVPFYALPGNHDYEFEARRGRSSRCSACRATGRPGSRPSRATGSSGRASR